MEEAIEAITDQAFAAVADYPPYVRDGAERLQAHLRQCPEYANVVVSPSDLAVTSSKAVKATAAQWSVIQELTKRLPEAVVSLRAHRLARKQAPGDALVLFGGLVTLRWGPLLLRRDYDVSPD